MTIDGLPTPVAHYSEKFIDFKGRPLVVDWSKETWEFHEKKHFLVDFKTASALILEAVSSPSLLMIGSITEQTERQICYYREHHKSGDAIFFTKVVVGCNSEPYYVKTVFKNKAPIAFAVKERNYPATFKEIWKSPKSYL